MDIRDYANKMGVVKFKLLYFTKSCVTKRMNKKEGLLFLL